MDFSLFLLCCIYLIKIKDAEEGDLIEALASIAGVKTADLEAEMEAPMDIDSSAVVRNWRRRASKAASKGIAVIPGLTVLIPGLSSKQTSPANSVRGSAAASRDLGGSQTLRLSQMRAETIDESFESCHDSAS